jgi:hypothetical protein
MAGEGEGRSEEYEALADVFFFERHADRPALAFVFMAVMK